MTTMHRGLWILAILPGAFACGSVGEQDVDSTEEVSAVERGPAPVPWVSFGGDLRQAHRAVNSPIDVDNVSGMELVWSRSAPGVTSTPVVLDGTVYWTDWAGGVHATRAEDGEEVWNVEFDVGFSSSPFLTDRQIIIADRHATVRALDRATGEESWSTVIYDNDLAQLWSSPMLAEDVIVIGVASIGTGRGGVPVPEQELMTFKGRIVGLDVESGELLWVFETTVRDGEQFAAGAASWSSAAIDVELGLAYIGTGNSFYAPASPYSDSLLALNYRTGELAWSRQFTENDTFTRASPIGPDSDVGAAPNLFDSMGIAAVGVGDKAGTYYAMDRQTGELLWSQQLTSGTSLGGVIAPAAVIDDRILVASNANYTQTHVIALDTADGTIHWDTTLSGVTFGASVVVNGVLFTGTTSVRGNVSQQPTVVALDVMYGQTLWSGDIDRARGGGISVSGSMMFTGYGFHVFDDAQEPIEGGIAAFRLSDGARTVVDAAVDDGGDEGPTYDPTFSAIYDEVLGPFSCNAAFCHGEEGGLKLQGLGVAYDNLVNAGAAGEMCDDGVRVRVVPGDPDASLLVQKLEAQPPCGARMPLEGSLPDRHIEQIRQWIAAGAARD